MIIIEMKKGHLPDVHRLAVQLGYTSDFLEFQKRFLAIINRPEHGLFVSLDKSNITGWIHLALIQNLLKNSRVEIKALIVDEQYRGRGIGKKLIEEAKDWCKKKEQTTIFLRSNISRVDAHRFYEREGFAKTKTSHIYELNCTEISANSPELLP